MMGITLQFSTSGGLVSWLIRKFTWSEFSHVDLVMPDGRLLGARLDGGVQIRPPDYQKFTKVKRMVATVTDVQGRKIYALARLQIGKPYQKKGIFGYVIKRDLSDTHSWFCDELISWLFDMVGAPLSYKPVNRGNPDDLYVSPRLRPEGVT